MIKNFYSISKLLAIVFVFGLLTSTAYGQTDNDKNDYAKEIVWGLNKNTNGGVIGGVIFRMSVAKKENLFTTYGLEMVNVKHPKELTYRHASSFVWGKSNFLYSLRFQYGRDRLLFKKAAQQGVQISYGGAIGPSIGIIAPYYIQYSEQNTYEQFDPAKHEFTKILGKGRLFQGLNESQVTIGANLKGYLNFEFGAFKNNVAGLEIGAMIEAYVQEVVIIPTEDNRAVFPSAYFTFYWGTRK